MHVRHGPPSHIVGVLDAAPKLPDVAVHKPIFPSAYVHCCPSFTHVSAGRSVRAVGFEHAMHVTTIDAAMMAAVAHTSRAATSRIAVATSVLPVPTLRRGVWRCEMNS